MELLRFITAGSVDDGKSTLIGRLLYDTDSILDDQLQTLSKQSKHKEAAEFDLALITDGLRAEREQGITIDVAYKYFATSKRKFIIADAPGHKQYTRNMITGASNVDAIIILIDARQGVVEQTKRHSIIATLLNIPNIIIAINKMDMIDYSFKVYEKIIADYKAIIQLTKKEPLAYIPMSALYGEGVAKPTKSMPWYKEKNLLELLESINVVENIQQNEGLLNVQFVIRPNEKEWHDYRAYSGQVLGKNFEVGQEVLILPQNINSKIKSIYKGTNKVNKVFYGDSVSIELTDDIDISRGNWIVNKQLNELKNNSESKATIAWMDYENLNSSKKYILQVQSFRVKIMISKIHEKTNVDTLEKQEFTSNDKVNLNDIVSVSIKFATPTFITSFKKNKYAGSGILIDEQSNNTVAAVLFED